MTQKSVKELREQVQEAQQKLEAMNRKLAAKFSQAAKMQAHAEGQIKKLQTQPPSARREHHLQLHGLRLKSAQRSQAMLQLLSSFNPMGAEGERFFAANRGKLDQFDAELKFIALEYSVQNYKPVAQAIEAALRGGAAPAAGSGALPGARASGPLSAARGTGRLDASKAPQPGAAPRASGPLSQGTPAAPTVRGTGPLSARAGQAPQPGAQAPAAPAAGTGPVRRPGTGPLSARAATGATGNLGGDSHKALQDALAGVANQPDVRPKLEALLAQYQEIEESIARFRGGELGVLAVSPAEAVAMTNKVNGLIYYMKRTIDSLPNLASHLSFEPENADPELAQYMANQQAAAEAPAQQQGGDLTSKLKSLFNL